MIKQLIKKVLAKKKCNVCGSRIYRFDTISEEYIAYYKKAGFIVPFKDFETLHIEEYKCPFCNCNDRDRLIRLYIDGKILSGSSNKQQLLDIAPSTSLRKSLQGSKKLQYRSTDLYDEDVDDKTDIQNMHIYDENRFDLIICSHVLEHVPDDRKALAEMNRILKPGGRCLLLVPIALGKHVYDEDLSQISKAEREKRFGQDDHLRLYTKPVFESRIKEAGFELELADMSALGKEQFYKYGISAKSVLYIGKKMHQ